MQFVRFKDDSSFNLHYCKKIEISETTLNQVTFWRIWIIDDKNNYHEYLDLKTKEDAMRARDHLLDQISLDQIS
jgi:hypothetical protein